VKALFLLQTDPYEPKPALRALREADALSRRGWGVEFVSWIKGPETPSTRSPFPVARVHVPVPPLGSSLVMRGLAYLRATRELAHAVTEAKPDVIIAHDFEALRAGVRGHKRTKAPVLYDSHEDWPALIAENSPVEARIAEVQERRYLRSVAHVFTVSEPIARKFESMKKPTTVLYNARPSQEVRPADRGPSRSRFGYGSDDFVVGFAGALGPGRGLELLLEALRDLPESVKALIVGGPELEARALAERSVSLGIDDRVRLDPYRPFSELAPYYAAMDVGTILLDSRPNHLRALPNKLFDYLAQGVPVIVPDYPAMKAIVRDAGCGWLLADVSREGIAATVREVQSSRDATARGARGREHYLKSYAWENQEAVFLRDVQSALETRHP
jgi:glycogen synthase